MWFCDPQKLGVILVFFSGRSLPWIIFVLVWPFVRHLLNFNWLLAKKRSPPPEDKCPQRTDLPLPKFFMSLWCHILFANKGKGMILTINESIIFIWKKSNSKLNWFLNFSLEPVKFRRGLIVQIITRPVSWFLVKCPYFSVIFLVSCPYFSVWGVGRSVIEIQ